MEEERVIVSGLNEAGKAFIRTLLFQKLPFSVLTNSKQEEKQLRKHGLTDVLYVNTNVRGNFTIPPYPIREVYIFESSMVLSCRLVQGCRAWTTKPIFVITQQWNPRAIYKGMGADHIIFSQNGEIGFLLNKSTT